MNQTHDTIDTTTLLRPTQAAQRLGVCMTTLRALRSRGELRPIQIGRAVRYLPADVARYVAELVRARDGTAGPGRPRSANQ